jgi:AcrR family transcriptional regulator
MRTESKAKISDTALLLFAKQGYQSTSIEQIATEAGVSKGLVYNYFDSKEDLLIFALTEVFRHAKGEFSSLLKMNKPADQINKFIDGMLDYVVEHTEFWRLQMNVMMQPQVPESLRTLIMDNLREYIKLFSGVFKSAGILQPDGEGWFLAASLDGVMMYYLLNGKSCPIEKIRSVMKRHYELVFSTKSK